MMHMCGCVEAVSAAVDRIGLDVYDVVQPTVPEMDIAVLQGAFRRPVDVLRVGLRADARSPGASRPTLSGKSVAGWNCFPRAG